MVASMNDDISSEEKKIGSEGLTAEDLELGKKAIKFASNLSAVALVVGVAITIYVFMSVPWDTMVPYEGRYGRNGLPMQVGMFLCLFMQFLLWRVGKKPTAHHMGKTSRGAYYVLAPMMIVGVVWGHWIIAKSVLVEGGALPG